MKILMVLNAQNAFFDKDGAVYLGEKADILRIRLVDYISTFNGKRLFFREKHSKTDRFFTTDRTHSIATTRESEIHPDFKIPSSLREHADEFYDKTRYNAFFRTGLEDYLKREKASDIELVGVETHTSILFTAEELRNRGYDVSVIEPCTGSRDDFLHGAAISILRNSLGVRIKE